MGDVIEISKFRSNNAQEDGREIYFCQCGSRTFKIVAYGNGPMVECANCEKHHAAFTITEDGTVKPGDPA